MASAGVLHPDLRPLFAAAALLAAYSVAPAIAYGRISPPLFFTAALGLAAAALRPSLGAACAAIASANGATLVLALDHIVGALPYWISNTSITDTTSSL